MKKYMVIYKTDDGEEGAVFADTYAKAIGKKINIECGLGGRAELYERTNKNGFPEYEFAEA